MDEVYTLSQIKEHWKEYQAALRYKVLIGGKEHVRKVAPDPAKENVTKCVMAKACKLMGFPKYLEML